MTRTLMSLRPRVTPGAARKVAAVCGAGFLLVGASACGGGDDRTATGSTGEGNQPQQQSVGGDQGRFPGADGKVAAVSGSTAQVQSQADGQVAVTWNGSTTFTRQVAGSLADVAVGSCVVALPAASATDSGPGSDAAATAVTAATVTITTRTDGTCTGGFGGGPGGRPPGGRLPEGATPPSGRVRVGGFGAIGAIGEVTAVTGTGFTVKTVRPTGAPSAGSTPTTEETQISVTVTGATTYTKTVPGAAADVAVGLCLRANGTADSTGAVTAKTVALSDPTDGECGGMMFRRGTGTAQGS
ncbi:hypothetical protein [Marmoricola sp. RAF53]|uniref:hypothetical protein n=1 Tax=Marmoricola sp. RAF53 TaxID=3233059 RepID=UPI003F959357